MPGVSEFTRRYENATKVSRDPADTRLLLPTLGTLPHRHTAMLRIDTAARRGCGAGAAAVRSRGFTLIELLIAMVICGILAAIALPAYSAYVSRSKLRGAQNDLVSLALNMENYYQQQLTYPPANTTTAATQTALPGWAPSQGASFGYQIQASTASSYTIKATGSGNGLSGYVLTLDSSNNRQQTAPGGTVSTW